MTIAGDLCVFVVYYSEYRTPVSNVLYYYLFIYYVTSFNVA